MLFRSGSDSLAGSLTRATGENVGTYAISSALVNPNYTITYTSANLSITARALTISADAKSKIYGSSDPALSYAITSGSLIGGDSLTGALTRASGTSVGSYAISSSLDAGANYLITYNSANLTITAAPLTITVDGGSKSYGATYSVGSGKTTFTTSGLLGSDSATSITTASSGAIATAAVGSYTITGSLAQGSGLSNYTISYVPGTLTITAAPLTITADNISKTYGATYSDGSGKSTFTSSGLQNSESIGSITISASGGKSATDSVGSYNLVASAATGGTFSASNYQITYASGTLTITAKAITVVADAKSKVYGNSDPILTYTATGLVGSEIGRAHV